MRSPPAKPEPGFAYYDVELYEENKLPEVKQFIESFDGIVTDTYVNKNDEIFNMRVYMDYYIRNKLLVWDVVKSITPPPKCQVVFSRGNFKRV